MPVFSGNNLFKPTPGLGKETGVALLISLVLLLMLSMIGVSAAQTSNLEVRMSRNEYNSLLAFQAAESALRDAEVQLQAIATTATFTGSNGLYQMAELGVDDVWENPAVWTGGNSVRAANGMQGSAETARYIIEYMGAVVDRENAHQQGGPYALGEARRIEVFRITARGVGGTADSTVFLQTTYGRIMN